MAYSGEPILVEDLLFKPEHSLIDQSLHARLGAETTNGDGFGIGWYGMGAVPAVFKSVHPASNNQNMREIAAHVRTPLLFARIRASSGSPVQRSNCIRSATGTGCGCTTVCSMDSGRSRRDLVTAVDPSLYPDIEGSTDSEVLFFLALTFGLTENPFTAVARAVGLVERIAGDHHVAQPVQMTVAITDGESMWVFRYSSQGKTRSLFFSTGVTQLRALHPEVEVLHIRSRVPDRRLRAAARSTGRLERGARVLGRGGMGGQGGDPSIPAARTCLEGLSSYDIVPGGGRRKPESAVAPVFVCVGCGN